MIGVSERPMLPAFGPVPTAVDMPVGVLRGKHDYKKKKKKKRTTRASSKSDISLSSALYGR